MVLSRICPATLDVGSFEPLAGATSALFQFMAVSGVAALCTPAVRSSWAWRATILARLAAVNRARTSLPGSAVITVIMAWPPKSAW